MVPTVWANPALDGYGENSFDNVLSSLLVLFEVATGDSWETVLFHLMDVPSEDKMQPQRDQSRWSGMFCIVFVFVGQLFMLQLFVSVIIDSFNFAEGSGLLTEEQALYSDMLKLNDMLNPEPKPIPAGSGIRKDAYDMFMNSDPLPVDGVDDFKSSGVIPDNSMMIKLQSDKLRLESLQRDMSTQGNKRASQLMKEQCNKIEAQIDVTDDSYRFCSQFSYEALMAQEPPTAFTYTCGKYFDIFITTCIMINIAFMCTTHYQQPDWWTTIQETQNFIFLFVFIFEFCLKHFGIGFAQYWSNPFDAFDGAVVLMSIVFVFVPGGAIAGLFRIGRVFRLIKRAPQLRSLMTSMIMTIPAISNVFAVLLLLFFIFAVIGVELFGPTRYGFSINQLNNYQTWSMAMLTLWRATLGNWRSNMYDTMVQPPFCTKDYTQYLSDGTSFAVDDCGQYMPSVIYHTLFQVFSTFAVLNVVIAIILGAFTWCYSLEESKLTSKLPITADNLRHFKMIWDRFDLYSTGEIEMRHLQLFLSVVRWNIPRIFSTGLLSQQGDPLYKDYSSFGSGDIDPLTGIREDSKEPTKAKREKISRRNFEELVQEISDYERSAEICMQLEAAGTDVWMGENDNVAGFDIKLHPLGSTDPNLHIFTKEINNGKITVPQFKAEGWEGGVPSETTLEKVSFMSLVNILLIGPLGLCDHDVYVCFDFKDPFSYFQPGYFGDKYPVDGVIRLNTDATSIRLPMMRPNFFKKGSKKLSEEDLDGMYVMPDDADSLTTIPADEKIGPKD